VPLSRPTGNPALGASAAGADGGGGGRANNLKTCTGIDVSIGHAPKTESGKPIYFSLSKPDIICRRACFMFYPDLKIRIHLVSDYHRQPSKPSSGSSTPPKSTLSRAQNWINFAPSHRSFQASFHNGPPTL
jgi:hypothetical protein